jgi:myo-inositol-1(or 4)-monophosphatase
MQAGALSSHLEVAVEAARDAGRLLLERFGQAQRVRHKGRIDLVTEADEAAERAIVDRIARWFPTDGVLAEEGTTGGSDHTRLWIVDPLDGTTNYAHAYPIFGVSIAYQINGVVQLGVVYQPILDELFTAMRGGGAWLNGKPIQVSSTETLLESVVCSGFPYQRDQLERAATLWTQVVLQAQAVRRDGAAAPDLCYVAMGRFDGFWERGIQVWDMAAGALIVAEAGGRLSNYRGSTFDAHGREIVATNGRIHGALLDLIGADDGGVPAPATPAQPIP